MVHNTLLTANEINTIDYLFRHYDEKLSINELAKKINVTPKGTHKILRKFESGQVVIKEKVANAMIYKLNFDNIRTEDLVKYALKSKELPNKFTKVIFEDLQPLKNVSDLVILYGSVLHKGLQSNDIDLLTVIQKNVLALVNKKIKDFEAISPKKTHLLIQTKQDLKLNLHKGDVVIKEILHKGCILWGYDLIYKIVENEAQQASGNY